MGHSQIPRHLEVAEDIRLRIYRSPGARAASFLENPDLISVLNHRWDLVILWLGSNDVREYSSPRTLASDIKKIVVKLEDYSRARVVVCLLEPRRIDQRDRRVCQDTYDRVARAVNRNLPRRTLKGRNFLHFSARPFIEDLGRDGVHFNSSGRAWIRRKFESCIDHAAHRWRCVQALGGPWRD